MAPAFFSFGCKIIYAPGAIKAEQNTSFTRRNIPTIGTRNYSWIHPRFYSPFWRNKPRHALYLQTWSVRAPKGRFCLFSLYSERVDEKTLNIRFFAKKQVNFWVVYLLSYKPLIINENMMLHRKIIPNNLHHSLQIRY